MRVVESGFPHSILQFLSALQKVLFASKDVFLSEQRSDRVRQDVVPDEVRNQRGVVLMKK